MSLHITFVALASPPCFIKSKRMGIAKNSTAPTYENVKSDKNTENINPTATVESPRQIYVKIGFHFLQILTKYAKNSTKTDDASK